MNVWTFYLSTSLIAVLINSLYCMTVNTTEQAFIAESSVSTKLLLL